jgi:hypothetical protein
MFDRVVWLLRWVAGVAVGGVLSIWLVAFILALAGFRKTAEALSNLFLNVLPYAAILLVVLVAIMLIRWLVSALRTQP